MLDSGPRAVQFKTCGRARLLHRRREFTYRDSHLRPGFLEGVSRGAVDAGAGAVDKRNGNSRLHLADALQHGPLGPAVRDGHVLESRFAAKNGWAGRVLSEAKAGGWGGEALGARRAYLGVCALRW